MTMLLEGGKRLYAQIREVVYSCLSGSRTSVSCTNGTVAMTKVWDKSFDRWRRRSGGMGTR